MFAVLIKESENATLNDIGPFALHWLIVTGTMAVLVLVIAEIYRLATGRGSSLVRGLTGRLAEVPEQEEWQLRLYRLFVALIPIAVAVALGLYYWSLRTDVPEVREARESLALIAAGVAGLFAMLAVSWEFLLDLATLSPRRIWDRVTAASADADRGIRAGADKLLAELGWRGLLSIGCTLNSVSAANPAAAPTITGPAGHRVFMMITDATRQVH